MVGYTCRLATATTAVARAGIYITVTKVSKKPYTAKLFP